MKRRMLLANVGFRAKLYGYYPFSDHNDYTINPVNLSILEHTQFVPGKLNNAIEFLSTGNASARSYTTKYTFSDGVKDIPFSFSFWIYYKGGGSSLRMIFGRNSAGASSASTNAEYHIHITTSGKLEVLKYSLGSNANGKYITCDSALTINTWYYVVYTDDSLGEEKFYINSVPQSVSKRIVGSYVRMSTTPSAVEGFGNSLGIATSTFRFIGMLDDFGIFKNHVLIQSEIDYIYNGGIGRTLK